MNSIIIPDKRNSLCLDTDVHADISKMLFSLKETGGSLTSPFINTITGVKGKTIKQNDGECKSGAYNAVRGIRNKFSPMNSLIYGLS